MHLDQQLGTEDVFGENGFSGFRSPDFRPKFVSETMNNNDIQRTRTRDFEKGGFHFAFIIEEGPFLTTVTSSDAAGTVHFILFSPVQCSIVNDRSLKRTNWRSHLKSKCRSMQHARMCG
jgi:hypothetical protein